jgi:biopolymer transport protein ExbD
MITSSTGIAIIIAAIVIGAILFAACRAKISNNTENIDAVNGVKPEKESDVNPNLLNPDSPYVKIYVRKSGEILLDGKLIKIEDVEKALKSLSQKNGVVLYSRDNPEEFTPHPNAKKVFDLIIKNRLPFQMCINADFSDAIDANGKLIMN